jgi:hypothetical protein
MLEGKDSQAVTEGCIHLDAAARCNAKIQQAASTTHWRENIRTACKKTPNPTHENTVNKQVDRGFPNSDCELGHLCTQFLNSMNTDHHMCIPKHESEVAQNTGQGKSEQ